MAVAIRGLGLMRKVSNSISIRYQFDIVSILLEYLRQNPIIVSVFLNHNLNRFFR